MPPDKSSRGGGASKKSALTGLSAVPTIGSIPKELERFFMDEGLDSPKKIAQFRAACTRLVLEGRVSKVHVKMLRELGADVLATWMAERPRDSGEKRAGLVELFRMAAGVDAPDDQPRGITMVQRIELDAGPRRDRVIEVGGLSEEKSGLPPTGYKDAKSLFESASEDDERMGTP